MRFLFVLLSVYAFSAAQGATATASASAGATVGSASASASNPTGSNATAAPAEKIEDRVLNHAALVRGLKGDPRYKARRKASEQYESEVKEVEFKYLQTEAHLSQVLGDLYEQATGEDEKKSERIERFMRNVKTFVEREESVLYGGEGLPEDVSAIVKRVYEGELAHSERYVFYHGMSNEIAFLTEVLTEFRSLLTISAKSDIRTLRALEKAFLKIQTADQFVSHYNKYASIGRYNYLPGYTDQGLSTNVFLFGNYPYRGSYTFRYFMESRNEQPPDISSILKALLKDLNYEDSDGIQKDVAKIMRLRAEHGLHAREGALLQILTAQDVVDDMAYIAEVAGPPP